MGFDPDKFLAETAPQSDSVRSVASSSKKPFNPDEFLAQTAPKQPYNIEDLKNDISQGVQDFATGTRSILSGASAGLSEPFIAGSKALGYGLPGSDEFKNAYDQDIQAQKQRSSAVVGNIPFTNIPVSAGGINELGGAILPFSAPIQILKGAESAIPLAEKANLAVRAIRGGAQAGLATAGEQALRSSGEAISNGFDPRKMVDDLNTAGLTGAAVGAAIPVIGSGVSKIISGTKEGAIRAAENLGGVKKEVIKKYWNNIDEINKAPTKEEAIKKIEDFTESLSMQAKSSKQGLDDAKDALTAAQKNAQFDLSEGRQVFRDKISQAKQELDMAHRVQNESLQKQANLQDIAKDVSSAADQLKKRVSKGSSEAFDILNNSSLEGVQIHKQDILDAISKEKEGLKIGGRVVEADEAAFKKLSRMEDDIKGISNEGQKNLDQEIKGQIQTMQQAVGNSKAGSRTFIENTDKPGVSVIGEPSTFPDWWEGMGFNSKAEFEAAVQRGKGKPFERIKEEAKRRVLNGFDDGIHGRGGPIKEVIKHLDAEQYMEPADVKKFIQKMDSGLKDSYTNGGFNSAHERAVKNIRSFMDGKIKDHVPEYRAKMEDVANDTKLYSKVMDHLDGEGAVRSTLSSATKEAKNEKAQILKELGDATGNPFNQRLQLAKEAELKLKSPVIQTNSKNSLPQAAKLREAENSLAKISNGRSSKDIISKATSKESNKFNEAKKAYELISNDQSKVSRLSSQEGAKSQVESFLSRGKNENLFKRLSELQGEDFNKMLDLIKTKEAFTKQATNGSRNVVRFGAAGGLVGGLVGGMTGASAGATLGGFIGSHVDKYGPEMTKKVIDQLAKMGKNPRIKQVMEMKNIPLEQKQFIIRALKIGATPQ